MGQKRCFIAARCFWCDVFEIFKVLLFFSLQGNGSLVWCQNHKQCSKVTSSLLMYLTLICSALLRDYWWWRPLNPFAFLLFRLTCTFGWLWSDYRRVSVALSCLVYFPRVGHLGRDGAWIINRRRQCVLLFSSTFFLCHVSFLSHGGFFGWHEWFAFQLASKFKDKNNQC